MDIDVRELKAKSDAGEQLVLVDVREPDERTAFNIGGKHIPLGTVPARIQELAGHEDEEIVVYCRSGKRSAMAQQYFRQAGFKNVRNLEGGMLAWVDAFGS